MTKLLFSVNVLVMLVLTACSGGKHTAEKFDISLYPAVFAGEIAFSEAESMRTVAVIFADSVALIMKSVNADSSWKGHFGSWKVNQNHLVIDAGDEARLVLGSIKEGVEVLNNDGEPIEKPYKFILKSRNQESLNNYTFQVIGAYTYFADAANMQFCNAPRVFPVSMQADHLAVERAFLSFQQESAERPFFIDALMRVEAASESESAFKYQLVITQFLSQVDMDKCP